jgi:protein disulfide-isomerase-like protein
MIMFYAPWCGHCKKMKPDYAQAAEVVNTATAKPQKLAAVDCTVHADVCSKFGVKGYPTIKYFKAGKDEFKYEGGRSKDAIINYMNDPKAPPPPPAPTPFADGPNEVNQLTDATFPAFVKANPKVLVMFYAPWCGHCKSAKPHFIDAAAELKAQASEFGVFAAVDCTVEKKVCGQHSVKGYPTILYFKNGKTSTFGGARTKSGFVDFMKDPKEAPAEPAAAAAGDNKAAPPAAAATPFMDDGKVNDVVLLTDVTFDAHVKGHDADGSLIMFYAPWCGHCKRAKPAFAETAAAVKAAGKGSIAAVDCTVHKDLCGKYAVKGFPTILFFKNGKNEKYSGAREAKDFTSFMMTNTGGAAAAKPAGHDEL